MNPVNEMLDSLSPVMILYVGFLGPIIEEYIFRWKLLNRLRRFGDKAAITYTALMFGLMHGNVTQFLYAIIGAFVLLIFNFRRIRLSDGAIPEGVKFRNICGAMYGNLGTVAFILVSLITMAFFLSR